MFNNVVSHYGNTVDSGTAILFVACFAVPGKVMNLVSTALMK
jgi:hypothetical protein